MADIKKVLKVEFSSYGPALGDVISIIKQNINIYKQLTTYIFRTLIKKLTVDARTVLFVIKRRRGLYSHSHFHINLVRAGGVQFSRYLVMK